MSWTHRAKTKRHGRLLERPENDPDCCRECGGACCYTFPTVALSWAEYERLRALGAKRLDFSLVGRHRLIIENGCEFLTEGRCAIYENRPDICRRFICVDE